MASEMTITASLAYLDSNLSADELTVTAAVKSVSSKGKVKITQTILTTETTLNLGGLGSVGYALLINRDPTNYIDVKVAASGAIFARLDPDTLADGTGGMCLVKLGSGAQVPVAIANSASCVMDSLICHA